MSIKRTRLLLSILVAIALTTGTVTAIYFAKGYRPNLKGGKIQGTGLLSATSYPNSAQVYIDDKLTTATDDTVNLLPGLFRVRISKEGFISWEKSLKVQAELVATTNARLFPAVPSLSAVTFSGAYSPVPSPDGKKIAYLVRNSQLESDNGLYVMDINSSPFAFSKNPLQIASILRPVDQENLSFIFSPDSKQILLTFLDPKRTVIIRSYLLELDRLTNLNSTADTTIRLPLIFSQWEGLLTQTHLQNLRRLPQFMENIASSSAVNVFFSPDGEKMLYTTTTEVEIPVRLKAPLTSINSTPEDRSLKPNHTYVYDIKEDTNYLISSLNSQIEDLARNSINSVSLLSPLLPQPTKDVSTPAASSISPLFDRLQKDHTPLETLRLFALYSNPLLSNNPTWYPTSQHLITLKDNQVSIFEYDNTNYATVYSGPFDPSFIVPSPNGNRLLLRTNLNASDAPANLYSLDLK